MQVIERYRLSLVLSLCGSSLAKRARLKLTHLTSVESTLFLCALTLVLTYPGEANAPEKASRLEESNIEVTSFYSPALQPLFHDEGL